MGYFGKAADEGLEIPETRRTIVQMEQLGRPGAIHTIWTMMTPLSALSVTVHP